MKRPLPHGCDCLLVEAITEAFDYGEATRAAIDADFGIEYDCSFDSRPNGLRGVRRSNSMSDSPRPPSADLRGAQRL
jgi:hypothetical protein